MEGYPLWPVLRYQNLKEKENKRGDRRVLLGGTCSGSGRCECLRYPANDDNDVYRLQASRDTALTEHW
jgi:hypothetical protein